MVVRVQFASDTRLAGKETAYPAGGNSTTSPVSMSRWKCDASVWARARSLIRTPASMFRSRAFGVRFADVTNNLLVVVNDRLGVEDRPGAVTWVDG
jgi:hypothetical protein